MKAFKKIVITALVSCLLLVPLAGTAQAEALFDPDNTNSILSFFGIDTSDPESIQNAIAEIREGGLSGIMNILGINVTDILDELEKMLENMPQETTIPAVAETAIPEETTEEITSTPATTVPAHTQPTIQKPLPAKPAVNAATEAPETTEAPATEQESSSEQTTVEEQTTANTKEGFISKDSVLIILLTLVIFIAGLGTGIFISGKISGKHREKYEQNQHGK